MVLLYFVFENDIVMKNS